MVTRRRQQQGRALPLPLPLVLLALLLLNALAPPPAHAFAFLLGRPSARPRAGARAPTRLQALRPFHPTTTEEGESDAMPLVDSGSGRIRAHGRHICLDYTGFVVEARAGAEATLEAIRAAVGEAGVREVHSRVVVLGEDGLSPPGFTGVCLVDESHVTAHCYSDRGWLAIDVFTCGAHPPEDIARGVHARLLAAVPGLHLVRGATLDRFLHHDLAVGKAVGAVGAEGRQQQTQQLEAAVGK